MRTTAEMHKIICDEIDMAVNVPALMSRKDVFTVEEAYQAILMAADLEMDIYALESALAAANAKLEIAMRYIRGGLVCTCYGSTDGPSHTCHNCTELAKLKGTNTTT